MRNSKEQERGCSEEGRKNNSLIAMKIFACLIFTVFFDRELLTTTKISRITVLNNENSA